MSIESSGRTTDCKKITKIHQEDDACKDYRKSGGKHVERPDSCLTVECQTYFHTKSLLIASRCC